MASVGCNAGTLAIAFVAAREIFRIGDDWAAVHALGGSVSSETQMSLYRSLATALRRQTAAVARRSAEPGSPVSGLVDAYRPSTRSEARRGGKECVSTCSSRWSPDH